VKGLGQTLDVSRVRRRLLARYGAIIPAVALGLCASQDAERRIFCGRSSRRYRRRDGRTSAATERSWACGVTTSCRPRGIGPLTTTSGRVTSRKLCSGSGEATFSVGHNRRCPSSGRTKRGFAVVFKGESIARADRRNCAHRCSRGDASRDHVASVARPHPVRVAVDGRPASGKTTLADELADALRRRGRPVLRATIDEFMLPRAIRYRRGVDSAVGCYNESFDFEALHRVLLKPLGPGGDRRFQEAVYDRHADGPSAAAVHVAAENAVLLFDGVFLMRPELNAHWELRILVATTFEETLRRARVRDVSSLGSVSRVEERFRKRYLPSQQSYFDSVRPDAIAEVVVENDRPDIPRWEIRHRR
jgi:uridine kinase